MSCLGSADRSGQILAPAEISSKKISGTEYELSVSITSNATEFVWYEINLYEAKLFQDTTVESSHPNENNAFGGMAFIGKTATLGEQWLYTRPNFSCIQELLSRPIKKAVMHIPQYTSPAMPLCAVRIPARFCSFGSTWSKKLTPTTTISEFSANAPYQSIDITPLISDAISQRLILTDGMIIRPQNKEDTFVALSTGDNFYAPQILEINHQ